MTILKLIGKTFMLFIACIIQTIGVLIEGMTKVLAEITNILEVACKWVIAWRPKKREKKANIDVPL